MTNIMILGTSGMLGSMVTKYFTKKSDYQVFGTVRDPKYKKDNMFLFDANVPDQLESLKMKDLKIEYLINCIGITKPFSKDNDPAGVKRAIRINSDFPWRLADYSKKNGIKVLQIGTDCVYSGKKGNYIETDVQDPLDVYGKSKSLGEVFDGTTLIIRSSIIGPEVKNEKNFLLEWFLAQATGSTISGFEHHLWNGITTYQFATICDKIMKANNFDSIVKISPVHHFVPNPIVNKFELMNIFEDVYHKQLKINRVNKPNEKLDRTLGTKFNELEKLVPKSDIKIALKESKEFFES